MSPYDHRLTKAYFSMQLFPGINVVISWKTEEVMFTYKNTRLHSSIMIHDEHTVNKCNIYSHNRCFIRIIEHINYYYTSHEFPM